MHFKMFRWCQRNNEAVLGISGWVNGWMNGWIGGWMERWVDGCVGEEWIFRRWMDGWVRKGGSNRGTVNFPFLPFTHFCFPNSLFCYTLLGRSPASEDTTILVTVKFLFTDGDGDGDVVAIVMVVYKSETSFWPRFVPSDLVTKLKTLSTISGKLINY